MQGFVWSNYNRIPSGHHPLKGRYLHMVFNNIPSLDVIYPVDEHQLYETALFNCLSAEILISTQLVNYVLFFFILLDYVQ